jgi:hypothetical protein
LSPYQNGDGMLEPYAVKVACTVLRRERAGNRSFLFSRQSHQGKIMRTAPLKGAHTSECAPNFEIL